jgi:hypothetical protein
MNVSPSGVSHGRQPQRRREERNRPSFVTHFQHHDAYNDSRNQRIANKLLPEYAFDFSQYSCANPPCSSEHFSSHYKDQPPPTSRNIHPGIDEAQFARNQESLVSNITPAVPYYGLERAIDVLESLDLADSDFGLFSSSDMCEALKLLVEFSTEPFTKSEDPYVARDEVLGGFKISSASMMERYWKQVEDMYDDILQEAYYYNALRLLEMMKSAALLHVLDEPRAQDFGEVMPQINCDDIPFLHSFRWQFKPPADDNVRHYKGVSEKSIQRMLRDLVSEVHYQSQPNEIYFLDIPINYSNLWSRKKIAKWKMSHGRSKEWRSCRFVKAIKKYLTGKFFTRKDWPTKISWKHSPPMVPINMLRRDKSSQLKFRTRPRKAATPDFRYLAQENLWGDSDSGTDDSRYVHMIHSHSFLLPEEKPLKAV